MPERVQSHRRKGGWRKDHPDAVLVTRATPWGNPFKIGKPGVLSESRWHFPGHSHYEWRLRFDLDPALAVDHFASWLHTTLFPWPEYILNACGRKALELHMDARRRWILDNLHTLRGKDLACTCAPGAPCHADVLIEMANAPEAGG